jgi:hypothetical protein
VKKRFPELVFAMLALCWVSSPCPAWEFSLNSTLTWEYDSYSQMGSQGFFGRFDTDAANNPGGYGGTAGSAASMNGWLGQEIGQISSGSDLALTTLYMILHPEFRLNPAVRVRGQYRIGSWATPQFQTSVGSLVRSEYADGMAPGIQRSFSPGYWETLWLSAQTPWGIVVVGKRPGPFGCGLMFDAADNADAAGILLMTPYGPFRFGVGLGPTFFASPQYFTLADKNAIRTIDLASGLTYDAGPISLGYAQRYFRFRVGPESATFQGVDDPVFPTGRLGVIPSDTAVTYGVGYLKYNNGFVFANFEVDWISSIARNQRWLSTASGELAGGKSRFAPWYVEQQRYMAEVGVLSGPAKTTFLWAWIPGPDRRHGVRIDRQSDIRFVSAFSNVTVFRQYSLIFTYSYGTGNNSITLDSNHGYMTDANVLAGRVDYAIAANLNLSGTFLWADRVSHGYGWGFIRPEYNPAPGSFTGRVEYLEGDQYLDGAPTIPDRNLGYEITAGFGWKLLEGYTLRGTFAFWQPGKWFSYACVDRTNPGWKTPSPANRFGTNPDRTIDPVFATEIMLTADF